MSNQKAQTLAPETIGVKHVPTASLIPNPHNPRMLFDRAPLDVLRESIGKVGILVPLTVYWDAQKESFVILDGQRRWMCAQKLGIDEVPVNQIAEPTLVQNIVTMFQIHRFREDWELMPTALKLEVLMKELGERNEKKLSALTGLDKAVVTRCKKLLSYSRKFQDLMLHRDPDKRIKADFFIELYPVVNDRLVTTLEWFSKEEFIQRMLNKYLTRKGLKAVTDFRVMKQYITNARRAGKYPAIARKLREFTYDDSLSLDHLSILSATVYASVKKLLTSINKIEEVIREMDAEEYYGEEQLWKSLERLLIVIRSKLETAGRRIKG